VTGGASISGGATRRAVGRWLGGVLLVELVGVAGTFLVFATLHLGVHLAGIAEPRIVPATIVETACGLCLAAAAGVVLTGATWAWRAAAAANAFSAAGVVLGIVAQLRGAGPTELNFVYHRVVLAVLVASLALLLTRWGRAALGGRT
jgi:hypothetical protein